MTDFLKKHSDIIVSSKNKIQHNYDEIKFNLFVERKFPGQNRFIQNFELVKIKNQIQKTHGGEENYFINNNNPIEVTFGNLFYY
jgi:hypothetical protein